jgi:predicted glutamine amidotransferase
MCDLFALSAKKDYSAPRSMPIFAVRARKNMDGWGIGYFRKRNAFVEKSANQVFVSGQIHDSFQRLARVVKSRLIICHVRLQTSGPVDECHAHPFILRFGGHDWIFAHNGQVPAIESYQSRGVAPEEAVSDSARAFEYLRDHLQDHYQKKNELQGLFKALCRSTEQMLQEYPGNYNYLLSNGRSLFAFTNHRQFMLLKGSTKLEGTLLLTTVEGGLSEEKWMRMAKSTNRKGLLMAISGADIILQQSL